jgi:predicted alpha/beta superfamily hydrolase
MTQRMPNMKKSILISGLVFAFLLCSQGYGAEEKKIMLTSEAFSFGNHIQFSSKILKEAKNLFIKLPDNYEKKSDKYPVIYILDGKSYFIPFSGVVKYLSMYEMMPEVIVVAIESGDRLKEFTYTKLSKPTPRWPTSGKGELFYRFLSEELIPYVEKTYRCHPFRVLVGHSLGGLFGIETMIRYPTFFQAIIAAAPSIYWNQYEWVDKFSQFLKDKKSLKVSLLLSMDGKAKEPKAQLDKVEALVKKHKPEDFYLNYKFFPEENHGSVALPALYHGLKSLFREYVFSGDKEPWTYGSKGIKAHFDKASKRYGYTIPIPEDFLVGHTLHGLDAHDGIDEALDIFQFCISLYPNSVRAYQGLARAHFRKGNFKKSKELYKKVLTMDPENKEAKEKLMELKKKTL